MTPIVKIYVYSLVLVVLLLVSFHLGFERGFERGVYKNKSVCNGNPSISIQDGDRLICKYDGVPGWHAASKKQNR